MYEPGRIFRPMQAKIKGFQRTNRRNKGSSVAIADLFRLGNQWKIPRNLTNYSHNPRVAPLRKNPGEATPGWSFEAQRLPN